MEKFIKSFEQNYKGIILMAVASLCTSFGQMFWKLSHGQVSFYLLAGFVLYGIGAVLMVAAFRFGTLSVLHPMLSLSYVFVIFIGIFIIKESLSVYSLLGILLIIIGVVFIGGGDE